MSQACPACGDRDIHHSRFRSWVERLRFNLTRRLPFRCHKCGWRGWREEITRSDEAVREVHKQLTDDELDNLDPDRERTGPRRRPSRP